MGGIARYPGKVRSLACAKDSAKACSAMVPTVLREREEGNSSSSGQVMPRFASLSSKHRSPSEGHGLQLVRDEHMVLDGVDSSKDGGPGNGMERQLVVVMLRYEITPYE